MHQALHIHKFSQQPCEVGSLHFPILQMSKVRHQMVKKLLQGYIGADLKLNLGSQTLKSVLLVPTLCCLTQAHTVEAQETQSQEIGA